MSLNLSLSPTKPLYVDRRLRPTYPVSSSNPSPSPQTKTKLIDIGPKDHQIQNFCYKSIEWHINDTFFMKKQLKLMLTNYFAKRNAELNELKEKNKLKNCQTIASIQIALRELLDNKRKIYNILKHCCTKHKRNHDLYSKLDAIKENIDQEKQDGLINLDCDDCLKIFTKFFVNKSQDDSKEKVASDENLEQPKKEQNFKRNRKKQRTSIVFSEKVSIQQITSRKVVDNITILDSLLDIELFNSLTKKKIQASARSIKLKNQKQSKEDKGSVASSKRTSIQKKRPSGFKTENHEETKLETKTTNSKFNILKQSFGRTSRISGADRFYQIIKEAIRTKDNYCKKTEEEDQIQSSSNSLSSNKSQCKLRGKKKVGERPQNNEDSNQSQGDQKIKQNILKEYRKKNKLTSRQGYLKRQKKQKQTLKTDTVQAKQQNEATNKSPKTSRQKNKVRTGNIKKTSPRFADKKVVGSKNKKNVVVKETDVKHHEDSKKMNKSKFADKMGLSKYSRHDKSLTGKEKIHSFRKIRKRQVFLKKNKEKSLEIKFRSISSESDGSSILDQNQCEEHGYSLSLLPKMTKYEAAREKFRRNYYQNSQTYRINLCNVSKPLNTLEADESNKEKSKRQKRPSINSLVPDNISTGYNKIPSKRSYNEMEQEQLLNILSNKFNEPVRENQKKVNQSSKVLLNILNNGLNNCENNLRETKMNIKYYLNRHKTNPKVLQLFNFFTYMEQTLQQDLKEKSRYDDPAHLALEADIEKVEMQNFMAQLDVNGVEDYEGCKFENQNLNLYSQNQKREPYEQRFITKLNNGVFDLLYWNQDTGDVDQETLQLLDQISLKQIEEIAVL